MDNSTSSSETGQKPEPNESGDSQAVSLAQKSTDSVQAENILMEHSSANSVRGDTIHLEWSSANNVQGETVSFEPGSANSVTADHLTIRQGGVVKADTRQLEMIQGGIVLAQTETAQLTAARAAVLVAQGEVKMEQSAVQALWAGGNVSMNRSGAIAMFARDVKVEKSSVVFLFAQKVEGGLAPTFGPRESILFGAIAGLVAGLVLLVSRQMKRRRHAR